MEDYSESRPMSFTNDVVYRARFIEEATKQGIKFGTNQFRVYHQLRWFEEEGKYGFNVAGFATIGTYVNLTEKEVTVAMDKLRERGIVQHILTDTRWYRKKTDLWATTIHLRRRGIDYVNARIEAHNKAPNEVAKLVKTTPESVETTPKSVETTPASVVTTPVTTGNGNNNINNNRNNIEQKQSGQVPPVFPLDAREGEPAIAGEETVGVLLKDNKEKFNHQAIVDEFERLWKVYPRKEGKLKAFNAYEKARKDFPLDVVNEAIVLDGINRYVEHIKKDNTERQFIKHGSTWFNGHCWEDVYEPVKPKGVWNG